MVHINYNVEHGTFVENSQSSLTKNYNADILNDADPYVSTPEVTMETGWELTGWTYSGEYDGSISAGEKIDPRNAAEYYGEYNLQVNAIVEETNEEPATKEISFNFWEGSVNGGIPAGDSIDPVVGTISATLSGDMTVSDLMAAAGVSAPDGYTVTNGDTILYGVQDYVVVDVECAKVNEPTETRTIYFNFWEGSVNDGIAAGDAVDPVPAEISATLSGDMTISDLMAEAGVSAPDGYTVTNGDTILYGIQDYEYIDVECDEVNEPSYPKYVTILYVDRETNEPIATETVVPVDENGMFHYGIEIEGYEMNAGDAFISEAVDGVYTVYITRKAEEPATETEYSISFTYWEDEKSDTTALWVDGLDVVSATYKTGLVGDITVQELLDLANPAMPEGDWTVVNGSQNYPIESGITVDVILSKVEEPAPETVTMNIQFKDGDEVVAGGDYFVPAGVQNYSVLEQYVPEGYKMTPSGDFYAEEGGKLTVNVEKIVNTVIMGIRFVTRDGEFVAGGDYFLPEGVQNYSILEDLVPEGYQMTVSGDFMVEAGTSLDVTIEKISTDVIMNIRFVTRDGTFVAGGDYFLPEGVQNLSILEDLVPTGYRMTETGDFMVEAGTSRDVTIELIPTEVIMNIQFRDNDSGEVVAGGDYFVPVDEDGIQNYSILQQYVPEGYEMLTGGDFFVVEGGHLDVTVQKIQRDVIMNIRFVLADGTFIAGGDYFLPEGIQNMSILEQYVPAGYKMMESGDFFVTEGGQEDITVEKINETVTVSVAFKNEWGFVVGGGYYIVPAGEQDVSVLAQYVPAGYVLDEEGTINFVDGQHYDISVKSDESIVNIQFIDREGNVIAGGDYFVPTGVQNTAILDELGYTPVGYRQVVHTYVLFMYGHHYVILVEAIPEQVTAKTAVFRKDAAEDVWNENPDNPDEVRYTFYSDDAEATNTVPSITVADETKELDYWVAEMDSSITLQPGEEFCYNDLDQGALKDQIGDLLFIAVYKDVEVVEPTPAPSEEPTPAPSEEPTPAPSEEPTPAPSEEPTPAPSEQPTAEPTAAPTAQPETPADNNDDNTTTVTSDNSDDVVKSDTPADNTAKVLPQTGVESSAPVIGFAFVLLAALGGAAAYLFVVRKKLN